MKKNIVLCVVFALAAGCFAAGTINHIFNTGEGIVSSVLLTLGCICASASFYQKKK